MKNVPLMYLRYIPNDTLKWLKNSRFYGSIDEMFDDSFSVLQPKKETQIQKKSKRRKARKYRRFKQHGSIQAGIY